MKSLLSFSALTAMSLSLSIYACSSDDTSLDGFGGGNSGTGSTSAATGGTGTGNTTGTDTNKGGTTGIITSNPIDPDAACGSGDQPAELTPVYMVFIYDKSGSMGDDPVTAAELADAEPSNDVPQWTNKASRWDPMKQGMIDFFTNSGTIGIKASLKFFPAKGDKTQTCNADYKNATMVSLETPTPLIDQLNNAVPEGGTPTLPAVLGGIARAKQLMLDDPGSKAVVVLVTDGEPGLWNGTITEHDCAPTGFVPTEGIDPTNVNSIEQIEFVLSAAVKGTPSVATYVVGIGEASAESLARLAAAGSDPKAPQSPILLDATQPPEATRSKLTDELKKIRTTQFQCSMPIPKSPEFRKDLVNVSFKHTNGTVDPLGKSANCGQPGWYFDNESTPTKIMLCPATCTSIQSDLTGKLQVLLGCPTVIL